MGSLTSKGLQLDKSDLQTAIGKPPPEGLVPVGDMGIYVSPHVKEDKPVSPFDCENYPDSPFCGGNPWTLTPVGAELEFTANQCGVSITGTPILGFTKLPPISVAWIAPDCRADYPSQPEAPRLPKVPKPEDFPDLFFPDADENAYVLMVLSFNQISYMTRPSGEIFKGNVGGHKFYKVIREDRVAVNPWTGRTDLLKFTIKGAFTQWTRDDFDAHFISLGNPNTERTSENPKDSQIWVNGTYRKFPGVEVWQGTDNANYYGRYKDIKNLKNSDGTSYWDKKLTYSVVPYNNLGPQTGIGGYFFSLLHFEVITRGSGRPNSDDYKKRKCCDMACCDSGQAQQRQRDQDNAEMLALLRLINRKLGDYPVKVSLFDANENKPGAQPRQESLASVSQAVFRIVAEIEKALKCIGIDQLPIYVPSSVVEDESNGLLGDIGDLKNKIFKQKIESIAEMQIWRAKNDNEIFGQWQEVIVVEDSDPTQKGNQPKRVVLPNMARTFKELILLNSTQIKVLGMMMDTMLKMYIDLLNTKVSTAVSEQILRDVQDFLDYPTVEKEVKVPVGATIPSADDPVDDKEDIERFLKNSDVYAKFDDWTGEGSLHDMMIELLQAAKQISAQFFNRV